MDELLEHWSNIQRLADFSSAVLQGFPISWNLQATSKGRSETHGFYGGPPTRDTDPPDQMKFAEAGGIFSLIRWLMRR